MIKPALTKAIIDYAMSQAERLKELYPKGLNSKDLAKEFCATPKSAAAIMSNHYFRQNNKRYAVCDVAAMLAFRWQQRLAQIKERTI